MHNKKRGIYIHIPFCYKKCKYCDFYSLPALELAEDYTNAVLNNIDEIGRERGEYEFDSIFFGGGTPSSISSKYIDKIINRLCTCFKISSDCEISIEANPATVDDNKLKDYLSFGVNRLSLGMQSSIDNELKLLGRLHNYEDFLNSLALARKTGFENINTDVMMGIPDQNLNSLSKTLSRLTELDIPHISVYMLKIEEGTPFYYMVDSLKLPDEDEVSEMYLETSQYLQHRGYTHYEISNFAKKGYECRHNLKYWEGDEYLGLGCGAHSYLDGKRYSYPGDIKRYIQCSAFSNLENDVEFIDESEKKREKIIFGLRLKKGIDISLIDDYSFINKIKVYEKNGYCVLNGTNLSLTSKGMLVSNYIISDILAGEN